VEGPHGFLHEYVSTNWEHGALYALLDFGILERIPLDGAMSIAQLAEQSHLPSEKLLRVCRLVACAGILRETEGGVFSHTAVSEELVTDAGFRAWTAFQCVNTDIIRCGGISPANRCYVTQTVRNTGSKRPSGRFVAGEQRFLDGAVGVRVRVSHHAFTHPEDFDCGR
jgi:hypothetical protein